MDLLCHTHAWCLWRQDEGVGSPGPGVTRSCWPLYHIGDQTLFFLKEPWVFSTTESPFPSLVVFLSNLGNNKGLCSAYISMSEPIIERRQGKSQRRDHGGPLLTNTLPPSLCLAIFLTPSRPTYPGMVPPKEGWVFLHQWSISMPHTCGHRLTRCGRFFAWGFLPLGDSSFVWSWLPRWAVISPSLVNFTHTHESLLNHNFFLSCLLLGNIAI